MHGRPIYEEGAEDPSKLERQIGRIERKWGGIEDFEPKKSSMVVNFVLRFIFLINFKFEIYIFRM
jgi:hypothetical protein